MQKIISDLDFISVNIDKKTIIHCLKSGKVNLYNYDISSKVYDDKFIRQINLNSPIKQILSDNIQNQIYILSISGEISGIFIYDF